jgi:hypothetical protein
MSGCGAAQHGGGRGRSAGGAAGRQRRQFDRRRSRGLGRQIDPDSFLFGLDFARFFFRRHCADRDVGNVLSHKIISLQFKIEKGGCQTLC